MEIVPLGAELLEQATDALVEAFKNEETTAYHLDTSRPLALDRMGILDGIFLKLYLEAGRPMLAAMEDGEVIGVAIASDPRLPISKRHAIALLSANIYQLIMLFSRHPLRTARIAAATKNPRGLKYPYLTVEALGVRPDHHGKGAGTALMRGIQAIAERDARLSGIYLNTGSQRNRSFYERLGYENLRVFDLGKVRVYHMFWRNPAWEWARSGAVSSIFGPR